jgi:hypothetical protein
MIEKRLSMERHYLGAIPIQNQFIFLFSKKENLHTKILAKETNPKPGLWQAYWEVGPNSWQISFLHEAESCLSIFEMSIKTKEFNNRFTFGLYVGGFRPSLTQDFTDAASKVLPVSIFDDHILSFASLPADIDSELTFHRSNNDGQCVGVKIGFSAFNNRFWMPF